MTGWIKISERKPDEGVAVLTKTRHGIIQGYYHSQERKYDDQYATFRGYWFGTDHEWMSSEWKPVE